MLSAKIKGCIKQHDLSVQIVADRMGISRIGLSQHINGNPSVEVLNRIADAIGCSVAEFFDNPNTNSLTCPKCGTHFQLVEKKKEE